MAVSSANLIEINSAVSSLRALLKLITGNQVNIRRFESCKSRILDLELPELAKHQTREFFESASRYLHHQEVGALRFELSLLVQHLRKHAK